MFHLLLVPIFAARQYLMMEPKWFEQFSRLAVRRISIAHNLALHLFSLYTFVSLFAVFIQNGVVLESGFYNSRPGVRRLLFLFYLSKYYEYVDTMILYAKGRTPIFLQKFHHVGATVVWHLGYVHRLDGMYFASLLNSGIHTVMYLYYLLSIFEEVRPFIKKYKIWVTSLQVAQLAYGLAALPWAYYRIETETNRRVLWVYEVYIGVLVALFCQFMVVNYYRSPVQHLD